ncbi:hypothetical protein TWF481_002796 [Arthrobotrys musiformis]|uniref:Uncharacterized protein n=1 Tax=Arthrobotrys musiformis TaxID=47236 RepID=A0AAV9VTE0_9PEZI
MTAQLEVSQVMNMHSISNLRIQGFFSRTSPSRPGTSAKSESFRSRKRKITTSRIRATAE